MRGEEDPWARSSIGVPWDTCWGCCRGDHSCVPAATAMLAGVNTGLFHSDGSGSEGRRKGRRRRRRRKMSPIDLSFLFSSQDGGGHH